MKNVLILLISVSFLATVGMTVIAQSDSITDRTGDVMHYREKDGTWSWGTNIEDKPHIDITEIKYEVSDGNVTLTLTIDGTIRDSEMVNYAVYLNTRDAHYFFIWQNGEGMGTAMSAIDYVFQDDSDPIINASEKSLTATFEIIGTFSSIEEFWGQASEYTVIGDTSSEWWADWAPNDASPYYASYSTTPEEDLEDKNGNGTPGFELFALVTAFAAVMLFLKKRS